MTLDILRAAGFVARPWKNGGGTTAEIAVSPTGAGLDAFDWRVSMARVEVASTFSLFEGTDRSIGILEGQGLELRIGDRGTVALDEASPAYAFPGDVPVSAVLWDGPILDLNVMTRRDRWRHHLSRVKVTGEFGFAARGNVTVAVLRGTPASITAAATRIDQGDAIVLSHGATVTMTVDGPGTLWIADLWAK